MEKIVDIIDSIAYEKDLNPEDVKEVLVESIIKTAKKSIGEEFDFSVEIDKKNKNLKIFQNIEVVSEDDKRINDIKNYISINKAKESDEDFEVGDVICHELTFEDLGRSAINMLYQDLEFRIQRLIEKEILSKYTARVGKIVTGTVVRIDSDENTHIEIEEVRAVLPRKNRIKGERFKVGDVVKSILKSISMEKSTGIMIELSRTTPKLLEEILRLEVPEIKEEIIKIERSARIPGVRAKIALSSSDAKVDSVGSTVGVKGVRINAVSKILNGENIDCIEYSYVPEIFISRALSPAIITAVEVKSENVAVVTISKEQKSKAIGKNGVNIRLTSMLTGYQIELVESDTISLNPNKDTQKSQINSKDFSVLESLFKKQ